MLEQTGMCQFWLEPPLACLNTNKEEAILKNIEIARFMSELGYKDFQLRMTRMATSFDKHWEVLIYRPV